VAVLICAIDARPVVSGAIGRLLAEHRAMAGELHACLDMIRAAVARGALPDPARVRETVKRLRIFQARRHRPKEEAWLFPRLRERTSAVDAELDELEHQHQRGDQLLDELAAIVEQNPEPGVPAGQLEQAVCAYAQFTWEHMGREEGVVLPAARRHLTDADWLEIAAAFDALALDPATANIRPLKTSQAVRLAGMSGDINGTPRRHA
jgi:hemerythrin-like domain-containing protein